MAVDSEAISRREQVRALLRVANYRPVLTVGVILGGVFAALLEGIGISFIMPIIELVQESGRSATDADGVMRVFRAAYDLLEIPLTLGSVVAGVSLVLAVRWTSTFVVRWLREALVIDYTREIQRQSFDNALNAWVKYFDQEGSDDILNAIVTQAEYAGRTIRFVINFLEQGFMAFLYLAVAFILAPRLTVLAIIFLGGFSMLFRYAVEPGYKLGDEVADANERVQQTAQAGTQGIRDTKLFGLKRELFEEFLAAVDKFANASIKLRRNEQAIKSFYNLLTAISVFVLIYLAIVYTKLTLSSLGIFLFAIFRLGPKASNLNSQLYKIENNLPHLVRTQQFIDELEQNREPTDDSEPVPEKIRTVRFDDVYFSYEGQEDEALSGVSFQFERGDFIGFVGQSGAGKSTIVSLLARLYEPNSGEIRVNGRAIYEMDINEWRSRIAVVRQDPFIFNDTLRYNLTIGDRDISKEKLEEIARNACIDEFLDDLPKGYETQLGDNGVRLSGGQQQRVALARALLKDADLLILDEATSDLDSNLEQQVQRSIEEMEQEYSIVGIAHRLSTVKNADHIYTVDDGEIIETGDHERLLESGGQYAELYSIQSQESQDD